MKIIFAGGGSGGHIFPSMAIAKFIKGEKLFIIGNNILDEKIISKSDFNYKKISSGKVRRYFTLLSILENFLDIFKFIFGFFQSLIAILKFKPDLIFCKGGFVCLPVAFAGKLLGKTIILHESDSVMGISNKIISTFSKKIFYGEKIGNPINFNGKIFSDIEKKNFKKLKNIGEDKKILFILGGSQGAEEINLLIEKHLETLVEQNFFIIHLTGMGKKINSTCQNGQNYLAFEFLNGDEYFNFLQISDLITSRAGAGSIAEILFFQKNSILIPLIGSAGEHQLKNAEKLEKEVLAKLLNSNNENFLEVLNSNFEEIEKNLKNKNFENPAKKIADEIIELNK